MKERRGLLQGIAVLLLACGLVIAGCDSGGGTKTTPGTTENPFLGNWSGTVTQTIDGETDVEAATLNFTSSVWTLTFDGEDEPGTGNYTRSGNTATLSLSADGITMDIFTAVVSGSTLALTATPEFIDFFKEEMEVESVSMGGTFTK